MSIKGKVKNDNIIQYNIEYETPIEVVDFTKALNAFASEYNKYIHENYGSEHPVDAKLHIEKIKEGSIETTLVEYAYLGVPFLQHVNTVFDFGKHLKSLFSKFSGEKQEIEPTYDLEDLKNLKAILEPGTEHGRHLTININGKVDNMQVLNSDSITASAMSSQITKEQKRLKEPNKFIHEKQALYFNQVKKEIVSKTGNYGTIENLFPFKLKVIFKDDKLDKSLILHGDHNPLTSIYIVDVEVQMVKDKPKIYKILKLHEILEDE